MRIIKQSAPNSAGKMRVVVEVDATETLMAVREDSYYRLGEPLGDVVPGDVITGALAVAWLPDEQKWGS